MWKMKWANSSGSAFLNVAIMPMIFMISFALGLIRLQIVKVMAPNCSFFFIWRKTIRLSLHTKERNEWERFEVCDNAFSSLLVIWIVNWFRTIVWIGKAPIQLILCQLPISYSHKKSLMRGQRTLDLARHLNFVPCILLWHIWNMIWVSTATALKGCLGQFEWHFKGLNTLFEIDGRIPVNWFSTDFYATSDERIKCDDDFKRFEVFFKQWVSESTKMDNQGKILFAFYNF